MIVTKIDIILIINFLKAMLSSMKHSGITVQHHLEIKLLLSAIMDTIK